MSVCFLPPISQGAEGIILESVLEGMAEYYSAELAEKVIRGQTENALSCRFNGGTVPVGYSIVNQHFVVNNDTAPLVLSAYEMYDEGKTMQEVADDLNVKGLRNTRGKKLTINTVSNLLTNRRYIGEYSYRDILVSDGIPAIVPKDLFNRVQRSALPKIKNHRRGTAQTKNIFYQQSCTAENV
jgi:site-specific DNA recombinase